MYKWKERFGVCYHPYYKYDYKGKSKSNQLFIHSPKGNANTSALSYGLTTAFLFSFFTKSLNRASRLQEDGTEYLTKKCYILWKLYLNRN